MSDSDGAAAPIRLGLLLVDGFALMSYAAIIEPYRAANVLAGRDLYQWTHFSVDGAPVRASNGAMIVADQRVGEPVDCSALFVFAAGEPATFADRTTFAWLRSLAARQVMIAGISGGPYLIARAGLLDGYRATIHWDHRPQFVAAFPMVTVDAGLYVIDRRRVTCAGGSAGLDLAIELIERDQGHQLARRVSEWFIRTEQRSADLPQRPGLRDRYKVADDRLLKVLAQMEMAVEEPLTRAALAAVAGVSVRQLERLFAQCLGRTIDAVYLDIRFEQAATLLTRTGLPITDIALACGFLSSSSFSRSFAARFGAPPTSYRAGAALADADRLAGHVSSTPA